VASYFKPLPRGCGTGRKEKKVSQKTCQKRKRKNAFADKGFGGMRKTGFTYFMLFAFFCGSLPAQEDTLQLQEITVSDYRSRISSQNFSEIKVDSATQSNFLSSSVAQMLLRQNIAFVRSYGPANIASLSVRGSTAQQTAVIWNGVNINNPMLGQTDVSLLPVGLFDDISLQKGALSGYWGSGAMAGALNLQSGAQSKGLSIKASSSYSTLQNFTQWVSADLSHGKWSSSTKMLADLSANKYQFYRNADSLTVQTQSHAQTRQYALMQDLGLKINDKQQIGLHVWLQDAERQVPYTLQEIKQDAIQNDRTFRGMLDWKFRQNKYQLTARAAFFNESLIYKNETYSIRSDNFFNTALADLEGQFHLPKGFTLVAGSSNSVSFAKTQGYEKEQQFSRISLFENISWKNHRINAGIYGRQEIFNSEVFVPTGGLTASVSIFKWLIGKVNAGTIYRYPTLNDLYWNPGGNKDLKPETGVSAEGSLQMNFTLQKFTFTVSGALFSRNVKNWIMWLPGKNGIWSPQNVLAVWSRGGETHSEITYKTKKTRVSLNVITNYVRSTRTETVLQNDESKGMQLPYVPMYSGSGILSVMYKNTSLRAVYSYTGYRYLTSDNYNYLSPYHIFDLRLSHTLYLKHVLLDLFVEGNNLLNENYFSMAQYPMPLRNFKTGITLQYKSNKKQNT